MNRDEAEDPAEAQKSAADWFSRLHSGSCTPEEENDFLAWLEKNPGHMAIYRKCLRTWNLLGQMPKTMILLPEKPLWRRREVMASAATLVLACGVFLVTNQAEAEEYCTDVGEQRRITLKDGSDVFLDTDSSLKFISGIASRTLEIRKGRVFVSTAPGKTYPLTITCAGWNISTPNGDMDLCLDRQIFSAYFRNGHGTATSNSGLTQTLVAGERMRAGPEKVLLDHPDATVMQAWKAGQLIFDNVSLAEAARQMNRYSKTKLVIDDTEIAALHISGVYMAGKCRRFAKTVALLLPVRTYSDPHGIHLVKS